MSIQVKAIAFVFHPVTDVARARKFYEKVLGLKATMHIEFAPNKWWIEYDIAGQALALSNALPHAKPADSLVLEVANLDEAMAYAKANYLDIAREMVEFPPCRTFAISDPDGNQIGLHQLKPFP
jgi:predicted enzyme related to lactoylglutathione lyase